MQLQVGYREPEGNSGRDSANPATTGFAWVEPLPSKFLKGELAEMADRNGVFAARIFGYWYGPCEENRRHDQPALKGERIFLHLHGEYCRAK